MRIKPPYKEDKANDIKLYLSARDVDYTNCPCPCSDSMKKCLSVPMEYCQIKLNDYVIQQAERVTVKYSNTKKSNAIHEQLKNDKNDIEECLLEITKNGYTDDKKEVVFLTSRYAYIKELLEKYWEDKDE